MIGLAEQYSGQGTMTEEGAPEAAPAWHCVRTHPKHEHIAAAQLRQIAAVEVFNPQLKIERLTPRGPVRFTESLFANYVFTRFVRERTLEKVRYTPSVKALVQFGEHLATIPDAVIEELRHALAAHADTIFTDAPSEGDEAEISTGPFRGEKGTVTRVLPGKERVRVLLNAMGRTIPAEFSLSSILFKRQPPARKILPSV
jgi:transcriptional antiterminator RfaH